jgi:hypothetical protein
MPGALFPLAGMDAGNQHGILQADRKVNLSTWTLRYRRNASNNLDQLQLRKLLFMGTVRCILVCGQ